MGKRVLIYDDGTVRRWRGYDDAGQETGVEDETYPLPEQVNAAALRDKAAQALTVNAAFLAITSPTNADIVAQVRRLTRENNALIRLWLGATDTTADT